jgi:hypothetical protein
MSLMDTPKPISDRKRRLPSKSTKPVRHPLRGALKGMVHVPPGVDLTEPAFPDWEEVWLEANAWWLDDPKLNPKR